MAQNIKVKVSRWTPDGIVFGEVEFPGAIGVTIEDGDGSVTYDVETGGITASKGGGRDIPLSPDILAKETA